MDSVAADVSKNNDDCILEMDCRAYDIYWSERQRPDCLIMWPDTPAADTEGMSAEEFGVEA